MKTRSATSNARRTLLRRGRDMLQSVSKGRGKKSKNIDVMELLSPAQKEELSEIHLALERIERGIFGACEECSVRISEERLLEMPWNPRCESCDSTSVIEEATSSFSSVLPL